MTLNQKQFRQGRLPGTGTGFYRNDPGEQSPDKWLARKDVQFHGTFREDGDWDQGDITHFGTKQAAHDRMTFVGKHVLPDEGSRRGYFAGGGDDIDDDDGWDDDHVEPAPSSGTGRLFARRLDMAEMPKKLNDFTSNVVHRDYAEEGSYGVPKSVRDSIKHGNGGDLQRGLVRPALAHLDAGRAVPYINEGEDAGSTSWMATRTAQSSWADDVLRSRRSSTLAQGMARHLQRSGEDLAVHVNVQQFDGWQGKLNLGLDARNYDSVPLNTPSTRSDYPWTDRGLTVGRHKGFA